jgi:hypothetical protein
MTLLAIALLTMPIEPPDDLVDIAYGKATHYAPGVMDRVIANRQRWGQLDLTQPHLGYVALQSAAYINDRVWLEFPDGMVIGPYLVADCARHADIAYQDRIGFAVDLSYELAAQLQTVGRPVYGVRVWLEPRLSPGQEGR